jgi:hypothetical protein
VSRTKGAKNKPKELKETLDPQLAKLTAITLDPSQDAETRRAAASALQTALKPPEPSPSGRKMIYISQWNKWECACDWFSETGMCSWCKAEQDASQAARKAAQPAAPTTADDIDLAAELATLERELAG